MGKKKNQYLYLCFVIPKCIMKQLDIPLIESNKTT